MQRPEPVLSQSFEGLGPLNKRMLFQRDQEAPLRYPAKGTRR